MNACSKTIRADTSNLTIVTIDDAEDQYGTLNPEGKHDSVSVGTPRARSRHGVGSFRDPGQGPAGVTLMRLLTRNETQPLRSLDFSLYKRGCNLLLRSDPESDLRL